MLLTFGVTTYVEARVQYDSTGRKIIQDNTIRGRRRALQAQNNPQYQAAAAAKFDYNSTRYMQNNFKNNYYQKK